MASEAQINANRLNALRSTGPVSPRGHARSAMNSRKRTIRSEQEKLGRDESIAYESRLFRWAGTYAPETDSEEFLVHSNLFVAGEMDRAERAYFEQAQSAIDQAVDVEIEEAHDTGNVLFSDPRGVPLALYGTSRFNNRKPGGPSWGSEKAPAIEPDKLVGKLESSAIGCFWMLGVLEELLENAQKHFWAAGDRLRMIRLLGRNPVDGIADRHVAEVFAASHAIRPVGKPFDDLQSDMSEPVLVAHVQAIKVMWRDLSRKDEPEKARQSLIDMVQTEIERIRALAAEHEQNAGEDAVRIRALKAFQNSPKAVALRREYVKYKSSLERGLVAVRREKRARKADSDAEALPPVPGKDISPYDGRPASWWRESVGKTGRRAEGGGVRAEGGGQGPESLVQGREGDCGSGGALDDGGSDATVGIGRETQAGGTPSVPATSNLKGREWDSVVVEESDVVSCGGYLPEKYIGGEGEDETAAALGMRRRSRLRTRLRLRLGMMRRILERRVQNLRRPGPARGNRRRKMRLKSRRMNWRRMVVGRATNWCAIMLGWAQLLTTASTPPLPPKRAAPPEKRRRNAKTKPICVMTCA